MAQTGGDAAIAVDDPRDPRLVDYRGLLDPGDRRSRDDDGKVFIVEGLIAIGRLLRSGHRVRSLLVADTKRHRIGELGDLGDVPVYSVPQEVIEQVAGFRLHRAALAAADRRLLPDLDHVLRASRTIAVLEGLNDVENLGAIARSARALGIDALVLDPQCSDPYYRRTVRVSMGEILLLPVARATDWPADLDRVASAGFETWALTPAPDAATIWDCPVPERLALLLGAEGPGLSDVALQRATRRVRIPLRDDADSLNVGHAAAAAFAIVGR